jgi:3-oxoacyl-[acyl-carrier protein] reductase
MAQLKDKIAIVTGGAAGFGEAIVRLYVKEGARVVIADLAQDKGRALASELGADKACFVPCDVADGNAGG